MFIIYQSPDTHACMYFTTFKVRKFWQIPIEDFFFKRFFSWNQYLLTSKISTCYTPYPLPLHLPKISLFYYKLKVCRLESFHHFTEIVSQRLRYQGMMTGEFEFYFLQFWVVSGKSPILSTLISSVNEETSIYLIGLL